MKELGDPRLAVLQGYDVPRSVYQKNLSTKYRPDRNQQG
jgi:hypothetical protein